MKSWMLATKSHARALAKVASRSFAFPRKTETLWRRPLPSTSMLG